ncbi:Gfo/Idh/MocA family oxidoreductase [Streptomyces sp. SCSIO ZS0520]|uniref:Gfo/Idh/MocA family oxidoreductase n=1 Tax=Streptomyces sp. SCSIO ZS0520 TaxID=2892996 RepID=UPI0021D971F1|nr:Gfo/Idh/MocA family oxidoreductase [Streptomyces sp. SCSIO ZS0520]UFZ14068.1 Gfo/Idh/MocA family oxidoreductase [Streptomyces sp.]
MLNTFIVGGGRAGLGLHWQVLRKLRDRPDTADLWAPGQPVVWDVQDISERARSEGLVAARSLEHAATLADPAETVVHLCTPPIGRFDILRELADLGYTRIIVEKPMTVGVTGLDAIDTLARVRGLRLRVVSPWLASALTHELTAQVRRGSLGALRSLSFTQSKPRWSRTLRSHDHGTAFDVELPHSIGVALRLAGDARVVAASVTDMRIGEQVIPRMGAARLTLRHQGGVTTEFHSDLTSPIRERRIGLRFDGGQAEGHYPISDVDHHASLTVQEGTGAAAAAAPRLLFDDALTRYIEGAYRDYATGADRTSDDYAIARRVVQLLQDARLMASASLPETDSAPPLTGATTALGNGASHEG